MEPTTPSAMVVSQSAVVSLVPKASESWWSSADECGNSEAATTCGMPKTAPSLGKGEPSFFPLTLEVTVKSSFPLKAPYSTVSRRTSPPAFTSPARGTPVMWLVDNCRQENTHALFVVRARWSRLPPADRPRPARPQDFLEDFETGTGGVLVSPDETTSRSNAFRPGCFGTMVPARRTARPEKTGGVGRNGHRIDRRTPGQRHRPARGQARSGSA